MKWYAAKWESCLTKNGKEKEKKICREISNFPRDWIRSAIIKLTNYLSEKGAKYAKN